MDIEDLNFDGPNILCDTVHSQANNIANLVTLVVKYYLFQQKCLGNKPTLSNVKAYLCEVYKVEEYNAREDGYFDKVHKKWSPVYRKLW